MSFYNNPYIVMIVGAIVAQVLLVVDSQTAHYWLIIWGLASLIYILRHPEFLKR